MKALVLTFALALATCQTGPRDAPAGSSGAVPVSAQEAQCEKSGGNWGVGRVEGTFVCYRATPDANKSCLASSECSDLCLARSRSCTPVTPFFGCHEVLTDRGAPATVCIE